MLYTLDRKNIVIPTVTDVVIPGDATLKVTAKKNDAVSNLHQRISEVETAIGQKDDISHARAHAIRTEDTY